MDQELQNAIDLVKTRPTVSVPVAGRVQGLGRNASYEAAHRGDIEVFRMGKLLRAPTAPLRRKLGLEAA